MIYDDNYFMKQALLEAELALEADEVPVGAVITYNNKIIARGHNYIERLKDVTAHAEMIAITSATQFIGSKYLNNCNLYVSLEPCVMCAGAIASSRIGKVIFAARDIKRGFLQHQIKLHREVAYIQGDLREEAEQLLNDFFKSKR